MSFRSRPMPPWTLPLAGAVVAAMLVLAPLLLERGSRAAPGTVEAVNATASSEPIQPLPDGLEGNSLHVARAGGSSTTRFSRRTAKVLRGPATTSRRAAPIPRGSRAASRDSEPP